MRVNYEKEDWRYYLPRGTRVDLAKKYNLTAVAVGNIIRREDVLKYPKLIKEARRIALNRIKECRKHEKEVGHVVVK